MTEADTALAALDNRHILRIDYADNDGLEQTYWCSLFALLGGVLHLIEEIGERSDLLASLAGRHVSIAGGAVTIAGTAREVTDARVCANARTAVAEKFIGEQAFQDLGVVAVVLAIEPTSSTS